MAEITKRYDVIIVGGGIAGLYSALNLDRRLSVLLISKRELSLSNSSLAQGGIAAVWDNEQDSLQKHMNDTLNAGGFRNDRAAVEALVTEGPSDVRRLIELGVSFDHNATGEEHLTLEGGHTRPRILHYKDCTGREITTKLIERVRELPNVTLLENTTLCGLDKRGGIFYVDTLFEDAFTPYASRFIILATGGIGRMYEYTTNSAIASGDGIAFAHLLGARVKNLNYIQFHPTAFADKNTRESFLISESVRGEGAYLRNCHGERFMQDYDERLELAPRDVVSRSIMEEMKRTGSPEFWLDITHEDKDAVKARFPMIYENLMKAGYDMTTERIPIFPCQHYLMGGIDVDLHGRSTIGGLYACGECAHTGVHGANRLASNSLLEGVVFSRHCAQDINKYMNTGAGEYSISDYEIEDYHFEHNKNGLPIPKGIRTEVRSIMQAAYFVTPNIEAAKEGFDRISTLAGQLLSGKYRVNRDYIEAMSLVEIAWLVLRDVI